MPSMPTMLFSFLLAIFFCSTRTFAVPTTNDLLLANNATSLSDIISRTPASAGEPLRPFWKCVTGNDAYTWLDIALVVERAAELHKDGRTLGTRRYPHAYGNTDNLYFGPLSPPYLEFPIRRDLVPFNGKRGPGKHAGDDRVVFQSGGLYSFLGVITHEGATGGKGRFIMCEKFD
ncbi:hypothetical protein LTR97_009000 [Elasticomyces elasticus]|uniref:ribonuclease T1 n=1 Tax=Elasticomyces elasticus TaxID=574655 RepID=A0AAN7ZMC4_9PEZI|nr:hypothetical protein LTR97_009000 [Elasticomyces elasticus]